MTDVASVFLVVRMLVCVVFLYDGINDKVFEVFDPGKYRFETNQIGI